MSHLKCFKTHEGWLDRTWHPMAYDMKRGGHDNILNERCDRYHDMITYIEWQIWQIACQETRCNLTYIDITQRQRKIQWIWCSNNMTTTRLTHYGHVAPSKECEDDERHFEERRQRHQFVEFIRILKHEAGREKGAGGPSFQNRENKRQTEENQSMCYYQKYRF